MKSSPYYQEEFVKPVTELQGKLKEISKDYEIPEEVMSEALGIENQRELNTFLSEHFDVVGANEVKGIVNKIKDIRAKAKVAEESPTKELERITAKHAAVQQEVVKQQRDKIVASATTSWQKSLAKIQETKQIPELSLRDNDTRHNEEVVKPIVAHAASEYGRMVRELALNGLTTLPEELSNALALSALYSTALATAAVQRDAAIDAFNTLSRNVERSTPYIRPPIGGSFGVNTPAAPKQPVIEPPEVVARKQMEGILARKRA